MCPHEVHAGYRPPFPGAIAGVALNGQVACSSVMSFQCSWFAITVRASHQLPAIESPTSATVSFGSVLSPNTHGLGAAVNSSSRQPCTQ